jgi:septal ring factor EnvC (AmiA/AmiB activator)
LRQKNSIDDKSRTSKRESRKYQEENASSKRLIVERDWRLEAQNKEMESKDRVITQLRKDKLSLEREIEDLR